jgi:hypothetical protein
MSLLTVTKRSNDTPTEYYVYYNTWNGEISRISTTLEEDTKEPYVVTEDVAAAKILSGKIQISDFIVSFVDDNSNDLSFMKKDNVLRLRSSELRLHQIPKALLTDWDIKLQIYKQSHKLQVEINPSSIQKLTSFTYKKHLEISKDSDLTLYVIKHNNPEFLIDTIEIDPVELLENGNIIYNISAVTKYTTYDDIGFITRRCFKNYYLELLDKKLINEQPKLKKYRKNYICPVVKDDTGHIEVLFSKNDIVFESKIAPNQLGSIGLFEESFNVYVVSDTPDGYQGTLSVDMKNIYKHGKHRIVTNANLDQFTLIHNKPAAKIFTRG